MSIPLSCLGVVATAAYVVVVMLLIDWYRQTSNAGFVWLGIATVVWPAVAWLTTLDRFHVGDWLRRGATAMNLPDSITAGELVLAFTYAQRAIGVSLLLMALWYLRRDSRRRALA